MFSSLFSETNLHIEIINYSEISLKKFLSAFFKFFFKLSENLTAARSGNGKPLDKVLSFFFFILLDTDPDSK